jgi:ETC complex I subunit conserved region
MTARISRPAKTAMQSGTAKTGRWLLEFEPDAQARSIEPLMGWTSSADTLAQVKLWFETKEEAMAYSDNFKFDRIGTWTH